MPRQYKINEERCKKCLYQMNISTGYGNKVNTGKFCGYILITGESRCFKDGDYRSDYRPGYCQVFKERKQDKRIAMKPITNDCVFVERGNANGGNEEGLH